MPMPLDGDALWMKTRSFAQEKATAQDDSTSTTSAEDSCVAPASARAGFSPLMVKVNLTLFDSNMMLRLERIR